MEYYIIFLTMLAMVLLGVYVAVFRIDKQEEHEKLKSQQKELAKESTDTESEPELQSETDQEDFANVIQPEKSVAMDMLETFATQSSYTESESDYACTDEKELIMARMKTQDKKFNV